MLAYLIDRLGQGGGGGLADVEVASAVEPVAPDVVVLVQVVGDRVEERRGLHRHVERGVEHRHLRNVGRDSGNVGRDSGNVGYDSGNVGCDSGNVGRDSGNVGRDSEFLDF